MSRTTRKIPFPAKDSNGEMDPVARDQFLTSHLGLVHHVARQLSRRLTVEFDFDELVSAGTIGLMKASESFDPDRGLAFSTFAAPRIMGAILDEVRSQDNVPRSVRRKSRDIARAREALTRGEGRAPSDRELAEELEVDLKTFWRWQSDVEGSFFVSLDQPFSDDDRRTASPSQSLPGMTGEMIENDINHFEEVEMLREAIMQLKEQERIVLSLYYFEELKLHQIGTILQLTESRVSQIHSRAIAKLRGNLSGLRAQAA